MEDIREVVSIGLRVIVVGFLGALGLAIAVMTLWFTIAWFVAGFEHQTWNKLHGTEYTQFDFFSGSDFIKKYHYPDRNATQKYELNLNN